MSPQRQHWLSTNFICWHVSSYSWCFLQVEGMQKVKILIISWVFSLPDSCCMCSVESLPNCNRNLTFQINWTNLTRLTAFVCTFIWVNIKRKVLLTAENQGERPPFQYCGYLLSSSWGMYEKYHRGMWNWCLSTMLEGVLRIWEWDKTDATCTLKALSVSRPAALPGYVKHLCSSATSLMVLCTGGWLTFSL